MPDVRMKKEGAVKNTSSAMRRLASRKEACFFWLAKKQADRLLLSNAYSFLGGGAGEPFFGSCKERFPRTYFIPFFHSPFIPGAFTKPFAPLNEGRGPSLSFVSPGSTGREGFARPSRGKTILQASPCRAKPFAWREARQTRTFTHAPLRKRRQSSSARTPRSATIAHQKPTMPSPSSVPRM